jgi:pSer/pThr/pTyr-binding forkhead associated (FHA) protein
VGVGSVTCEATVVRGELSTWATLTGTTGQVVEVRPNRALIGRSVEADVIINAAEVSRHHALIYRQDGESFALDLGSANGTRIDGTTIKKSPVRIPDGSVLTLADLDFRFQVS